MSARSNRGIGPVPEGLDDGLQDFLMQVRRHITDVLAGKVTVASSGSSSSGGSVTVIGGGGGGGTPYEPDLTPPPAPTGVVITAGFANVLIETDAPTFTQGHGHLKTIVYGKKYGGTGPLPTFSSDSKQREFTGNVDSMPSDLGTEWHFWLSWVTKDGVEGAVAGGVNGYTATLGKVGSSDLGTAIVLSQNLAPGSVTADKAALDIGGSNLVGNNSFELDSNADGIADGWALYDGTGGGSLSRVAGRISGYAQRYTTTAAVDHWARGVSGGAGLLWQPNKQYVVSFYARAPSGSGFLAKVMGLAWNTAPTIVALKNPGLGTGWQRYAFRLTWGASVEGAGPLYVTVPSQGTPTGSYEIDDLQVEEGDTLTAYAGKLALNTIVAGDGAISNFAVTNLLVADAAIDNAKIANVSVAKLLAGALSVGQYVRSSNYVAGTSGWNIHADGSAEFGAASIRGQLTASQINANGLSIRKPDGSLILDASGAGTPIHYSQVLANGGWLNSNISIGANGALSGAGGGQVTLPGMGQHSYRIYCFGYQIQLDGTATAAAGIYADGASTPNPGAGGYMVVVISRATGQILTSQGFNILGGGTAPADMAAYLNALDSTKIVAIYTNDEPASNRMNSGLPAAMYRCGASRAVFGSPQFQYRSAYVLVGIVGCGEGNGAEFYQGSVSSDPNAWCDASFTVLNGGLTGVSANYTPRTLADYNYTGDLNATNGATIGANLGGSFTQATWDVVMTSTYIRASHIQQLTANNLTVDALSRTMNGQVSGTPSGQRLEMVSNGIQGYDVTNALRWEIGIF